MHQKQFQYKPTGAAKGDTKSKESNNFLPNPTNKDKSFFDRVKEMFG